MGPAGATINAILQAGWRPARPDLWHHADGNSLHLDGKPFTRFRTIAAAHEALQNQAWKRAAKNEHGAGLETGIPSFAAARRAIKYLHKHGFHKQAKALEFVLVGFFFRDPEPDEPGHKAWCKRCGKRARATRRRIVYECLDNENISEGIFKRTNAILNEATEQHFALYSVLWFRGIIPRVLLPQRDRATIADAKIWMTEGFDEVMRKSKIGYSDGTGGQADVPLAIRPAGWGAATFLFKV